MLRAHLWRAAAGEAKCRRRRSDGGAPRADPRDPAVTPQQLPLCSSLWKRQHLAVQSRPLSAHKFGVQLSNCHMAVGLWGTRSVIRPVPPTSSPTTTTSSPFSADEGVAMVSASHLCAVRRRRQHIFVLFVAFMSNWLNLVKICFSVEQTKKNPQEFRKICGIIYIKNKCISHLIDLFPETRPTVIAPKNYRMSKSTRRLINNLIRHHLEYIYKLKTHSQGVARTK